MKSLKILLLIAAVWCYAYSAFAQTWTQTSAPTNYFWNRIACSADGSKIVATFGSTANGLGGYIDSGGIFVSTNSGVSWFQAEVPTNYWRAAAASADGTKLVAIGADWETFDGLIYTSTNSGLTWAQGGALSDDFFSIASSADGVKLGAVVYSGGIYTSTNSGATWTQSSATNAQWSSIASSADGTKLVAVVNGGTIYMTTDSGATWNTASTISGDIFSENVSGWHAVASSADGKKLAAADLNHIFISADSGTTWTQTSAPLATWASIASSADGTKLIASSAFQSFLVYTSTNSGATWISNNIPDQYQYSVACSADGNDLFASSSRHEILIASSTPAPSMNITPANGNLTVSWIIPSTNFVMQQSADLQNWANMTNQPVLNLTNLQNQVFLPPPGSNVFYRLKTP